MDKRARIEASYRRASTFRRLSVLLPLVIVAMGLTLERRAGAVSKKLLSEPPELVLMVVVDQMRADFLRRHYKRFLPPDTGKGRVGGFRFLMEGGSYFPAAEFNTMHTLTAPNHATIATGAWPNRHGVVMNRYLDASLKSHYCVGDGRYRVIGGDPKHRARGVAPTNLEGPTLGDAMKSAGYQGRVVSLALKDRAAILMGGYRSDASVWFDYRAHRWVTSSFYEPKGSLPSWVKEANAKVAKHVGKKLQVKGEGAGSGHSDDGPVDGYTRDVRIGDREAMVTPYGHAIIVDAAIGAMKHYKLGEQTDPDMLWLGFSSVDYLGHGVGPNHREMEESVVALDKQISRLLNYIKRSREDGLKGVVVVLTGDHGAPPMPSYLKRHRAKAGYIDAASVRQRLNQHLDRRFSRGKMHRWVGGVAKLHFYLDRNVLKAVGVSKAEVERASRDYLTNVPNVAYVAIGSEIREGRAGAGLLGRQIINGYYPGRSGDIVIIPKPYFMPKVHGLTHITGYTYDRTVPLIFWGERFRDRIFANTPEMIDLVPTMALLLGFTAPALSEGRVLHEVFRDK